MELKVWDWISCRNCKSRMEIIIIIIMFIIFTICFTSSASASNAYISHTSLGTDQLQEPRLFAGRTLLQAEKPCPINFENQTYTIITSRCKGPKYPADVCCDAFKDFACPFADQLNDLNNNCAKTMFSYINLNGNYPAGLFANECKGSKRGLECPADASSGSSHALPHRGSLMWLLSGVAFIIFRQIL